MKKFVLATVFALASTGVLAKDLSVIRFGVDPTFAPFESKTPTVNWWALTSTWATPFAPS